MMLSYQGAGVYNVYLGQSLIVMDEEQIVELVEELFDKDSYFEIPRIDSMIEERQELERTVEKLGLMLQESKEEVALLMMQLQEKETE